MVCSAWALGGCGEEARPATDERGPSPPAPAQPPAASDHAAAAAASAVRHEPLEGPRARLTRLDGAVTPIGGGAVLRAPSVIEGLFGLQLAEGASAVLDLPSQGRAALAGPAQVYLGADREGQVLLVSGSVHLTRAPGGLSRATAPRVATPDASVELVGPGEVLVTADPLHGTHAAVLAGNASLATGEASEGGELRSLALSAGTQVLAVGGRWPSPPEKGPRELEAARSVAARALEGLPRGVEPSQRALAGTKPFEATASALAAAKAEGRALVDRQRGSAKAKQRELARGLQGAVVNNARAMLRLRTTLFVRWERLQATSLAARPWAAKGGVSSGAAAAQEQPFGSYAEQAHSLLGAPRTGDTVKP